MRPTLILPLVCLATLMAGCGGDEKSSSGDSSKDSGSSSSSGKMPDNMCEAVAPAVPENWKLTKKAAPQKNRAKTDCTLTDESGYKTTLTVGVQQPKSGSRLPSFKEFCDFYVPTAQEQDDEECTQTGPIKLGGAPAQLQRGVLLDDPPRFLFMGFRTNKADIAAEAEDVLDDVEDAASGG
jgi:hypothetical protein